MSTPPLNEDHLHQIRTPRHNLSAGVTYWSPSGWPIKYSGPEFNGEPEYEAIKVLGESGPWGHADS